MAKSLRLLSVCRSALLGTRVSFCSSAAPGIKHHPNISSMELRKQIFSAKELASTFVKTASIRSYYVDLKEIQIQEMAHKIVKLSEVSKNKRSTILFGLQDLDKLVYCIDSVDLSEAENEKQTLDISFKSENFSDKTYGINFQKYQGRTEIVISESFLDDNVSRKMMIYVDLVNLKNLVSALKKIINDSC